MPKRPSASRALTHAIQQRDMEAMRNAIKAGANVNRKDASGCTPLMDAVCQSFVPGIVELLANGAKVGLRDEDGWTAADHAIDDCNLDVLQFFSKELTGEHSRKCTLKLQMLDSPSRADVNRLFQAVRSGDAAKIIEQLNSVEIDVRNEYGETCLMLEAAENQKQMVAFLLEQGASANLRSLTDHCPLEYAVRRHSGATYDLLYPLSDALAKERTREQVEDSKQHYNWRYDRPDLDEQRERQTVSDDEIQDIKKSASHWGGKRKIVDVLDEHNLPVSILDKDGRQPLSWSIGNLDDLFDLLARGADPDHRDYYEKTALHYADFQAARILWSRTTPELRERCRGKFEKKEWDFVDT